MHIGEYDKKVEIIGRYRAASGKNAKVTRGDNAIVEVELRFDDEQHDFTLSGSEMTGLLSSFPDASSVDELFQ